MKYNFVKILVGSSWPFLFFFLFVIPLSAQFSVVIDNFPSLSSSPVDCDLYFEGKVTIEDASLTAGPYRFYWFVNDEQPIVNSVPVVPFDNGQELTINEGVNNITLRVVDLFNNVATSQLQIIGNGSDVCPNNISAIVDKDFSIVSDECTYLYFSIKPISGNAPYKIEWTNGEFQTYTEIPKNFAVPFQIEVADYPVDDDTYVLNFEVTDRDGLIYHDSITFDVVDFTAGCPTNDGIKYVESFTVMSSSQINRRSPRNEFTGSFSTTATLPIVPDVSIRNKNGQFVKSAGQGFSLYEFNFTEEEIASGILTDKIYIVLSYFSKVRAIREIYLYEDVVNEVYKDSLIDCSAMEATDLPDFQISNPAPDISCIRRQGSLSQTVSYTHTDTYEATGGITFTSAAAILAVSLGLEYTYETIEEEKHSFTAETPFNVPLDCKMCKEFNKPTPPDRDCNTYDNNANVVDLKIVELITESKSNVIQYFPNNVTKVGEILLQRKRYTSGYECSFIDGYGCPQCNSENKNSIKLPNPIKEDNSNLLSLDSWNEGSGSIGQFNMNGTSDENHRVKDLDPWGNSKVLWEAKPDAAWNADGGWNSTLIPIDHNELYRVSVWVNRKKLGSTGRFYLGAKGFGDANGLERVKTGALDTNPYFWSSSATPSQSFNEDEWVLVVGHIFPNDHSGTSNHKDSGRYTIEGNKIGNIRYDFKWLEGTHSSRHRSYLFYSDDPSVRQQWAYPRFDLVDGTEPSIEELLNGIDNNADNGASIAVEVLNGEAPYSIEVYIKSEDGSKEYLDANEVLISGDGTVDNNFILTNVEVGENICYDIMDANCCVSTSCVIVPCVFPVEYSTSSDLCDTDENEGSITLSGVNGYDIQWSDGSTESIRTGLSPGVYSVVIINEEECYFAKDFIIDSEIDFGITGETMPSSQCKKIGQINLDIDEEAYNVKWSNDMEGPHITELSRGTYCATITDLEQGCVNVECYDVETLPNLIVDVIPVIACNDGSGSATAIVDGGQPPYEYLWDSGETTQTATNLEIGNNPLRVTDANGCSVLTSFVVDSNPPIEIDVTLQAPCAEANDGYVVLDQISGGTGPGTYTVQWSNGSNNLVWIPNLSAGIYSVTISDENGCQLEEEFDLSYSNNIEISYTVTPDLRLCDNHYGSVSFDISGGGAPYEIHHPERGLVTSPVENLDNGNHTFLVTDNCGNSSHEVVHIPEEFNTRPFLVNTISQPSCFSFGNGSLEAFVSGVGAHTFQWSNGSTGPTASSLEPGNYSVTVTNDAGCEQVHTANVENGEIQAELIPSSSCTHEGIGMGSISLIIDDPDNSNTYLWSNNATTRNISNLLPGTYSVQISNSLGCEKYFEVTVQFEEADIDTEIQSFASCNASDNGTGILNLIIDDSIESFTYAWSTGATTKNVTGLIPGSYWVQITNSDGCSKFVAADVEFEESEFEIVNQTQGDCKGMIDIEIEGSSEYSYFWNNGDTTQDLIGVESGVYNLTVTDLDGCQKYEEFEVTEESDFEFQVFEINRFKGTRNGGNAIVLLQSDFFTDQGELNITNVDDEIVHIFETGEIQIEIPESNFLEFEFQFTYSDSNSGCIHEGSFPIGICNLEQLEDFWFEVSFQGNPSAGCDPNNSTSNNSYLITPRNFNYANAPYYITVIMDDPVNPEDNNFIKQFEITSNEPVLISGIPSGRAFFGYRTPCGNWQYGESLNRRLLVHGYLSPTPGTFWVYASSCLDLHCGLLTSGYEDSTNPFNNGGGVSHDGQAFFLYPYFTMRVDEPCYDKFAGILDCCVSKVHVYSNDQEGESPDFNGVITITYPNGDQSFFTIEEGEDPVAYGYSSWTPPDHGTYWIDIKYEGVGIGTGANCSTGQTVKWYDDCDEIWTDEFSPYYFDGWDATRRQNCLIDCDCREDEFCSPITKECLPIAWNGERDCIVEGGTPPNNNQGGGTDPGTNPNEPECVEGEGDCPWWKHCEAGECVDNDNCDCEAGYTCINNECYLDEDVCDYYDYHTGGGDTESVNYDFYYELEDGTELFLAYNTLSFLDKIEIIRENNELIMLDCQATLDDPESVNGWLQISLGVVNGENSLQVIVTPCEENSVWHIELSCEEFGYVIFEDPNPNLEENVGFDLIAMIDSTEIGINETESFGGKDLQAMRVYPNPFKNTLDVIYDNTEAFGKGELFIIDMLGRTVISNPVEILKGKNHYTLSNLDEQLLPGVYSIVMKNEDKLVAIDKIIRLE